MTSHSTQLGKREEQSHVDQEVATLILQLHRVGVEIVNAGHVEDDEGWLWIDFIHAMEAERFLNLVALWEEGGNTFYRRATGLHLCSCCREKVGAWHYIATPIDVSRAPSRCETTNGVAGKPTSAPDFMLNIEVHMPSRDLPLVLERLAQAPDAEIMAGDH